MHQVDDTPMETLHIYLEREQPPRPSLLPIFLSVLALLILVSVGVLSPTEQPVTRAVIRVPAVPLSLKTFTAQVAIIPTGVRVYPATRAHGWLTFSNGSIIGQSVPVGYVVGGSVTDRAVYVPPGSANGYGYATVAAHALIPGKGGNFDTFTINAVIGDALFVRNLTAFSGGKDMYSVKFATVQDKVQAIVKARSLIDNQVSGLHYPCKEEYISGNHKISLNWRCQFIRYSLPAFYHVTAIRLSGKNLVIDIWFIARPARIWVK